MYMTGRFVKSLAINNLESQVQMLTSQLQRFDQVAKFSAERLMDVFLSMNPKGSNAIRPDIEVCDRFTAMTGGSVATIFKKEGDDFRRIATSLTKEDGTRAVGTFLGKNHPGYRYLIVGEPYVGKANLFGKEYMTKYVPVKSETGEVTGILFIGFHITNILNDLLSDLAKFKIGEKGFVNVYDVTKEEPRLLVGREIPKKRFNNNDKKRKRANRV